MQCMQRERPAAAIMTSLTIRRIDPAIKERLRVRAARHGRSMEEEARRILGEACVVEAAPPPRNAYEAIRRHFEALGGVELEPPPRGPAREPPAFD
jgi:plasmid stability protein